MHECEKHQSTESAASACCCYRYARKTEPRDRREENALMRYCRSFCRLCADAAIHLTARFQLQAEARRSFFDAAADARAARWVLRAIHALFAFAAALRFRQLRISSDYARRRGKTCRR